MFLLLLSSLIQVPVGGPAEVDEIFDLISYSKGASVIRMLHDYIGDEVKLLHACPVRCTFLAWITLFGRSRYVRPNLHLVFLV